ncbi:MAG: STAS domain-containing protein [bacterium]
MTEIKKSLASDTAITTATVAATIDFTHRRKLVELRLEGTILGEHSDALRDFLRNLSYFPGNRWALQLENLDVMSLRALKVLLNFVKIIRRRGHEIEVVGIQAGMLAMLMDLGLHGLFAWKRLSRQYNFSHVEALDELSANIFPEEVEVPEERVYAF